MDKSFNKYKLPLSLLMVLEPFLNKNADLYTTTIDKNGTISLVFKERLSGFYFRIEGAAKLKDGEDLVVVYVPGTESSLHQTLIKINTQSILPHLELWDHTIRKYISINISSIDDSSDAFENELSEEFDFVEDETMDRPLKVSQILELSQRLEEIGARLSEFTNSINEVTINEAQHEILLLNESLTTLTKREVIQKVKKIWSKLIQAGVPVIKEFLSEVKKEAFKQIIKGAVEGGHHLLDTISIT